MLCLDIYITLCVRTRVRTNVRMSLRLSVDLIFCMSTACFEVFTDAEEEALLTYLITSSKMFHGVTQCATRRLVYEDAERYGMTCPSSWHVNKKAGVDWLHGFLKRRNELGLRKP